MKNLKYKCQCCGKPKTTFDQVAGCCLVMVNHDVQPPTIGTHGYKNGYYVARRPKNYVWNDTGNNIIRCGDPLCGRIIPPRWLMVAEGEERFCVGCYLGGKK